MSPPQPRSQLPPAAIGTKQEIQARSGTATFVPKGHTIKIINSYGTQVVGLWAFALHDAPSEEELDHEQQPEPQIADAESSSGPGAGENLKSAQTQDLPADPMAGSAVSEAGGPSQVEPVAENTNEIERDPNRQKDAGNSGPKKRWTAYIPTVHRSTASESSKAVGPKGEDNSSTPRKTWASYIPSVPAARGSGTTEKKQSRNWASYIPSGHGFSSYIPKDALHAISEVHKRDPEKSVAQQLYDFSKTPAAAGLSSKLISRISSCPS